MNIYVLMKVTFDTEEKIVLKGGQIDEESAEFIINPYDEYAIEEAIKVKEAADGTITVISVGTEENASQLRTALAMGADQAVLIDIGDDIRDKDPSITAQVIVHYLKDKNIDLILAGNVAIDGGSGQVGPRVAEGLGINCVTTITKLELDGKRVRVARDIEGDAEIIETNLPLLVTAQQGLNEPRYPTLPGIMKAKKKPLAILDLDDLDLDADDVIAKNKRVEIFLPRQKQKGRILEGKLEEQVKKLAHILCYDEKII